MTDERLAEAKKTIMLLQEELEVMRRPPYMAATVLGLGEKTARISTDSGDLYEIELKAPWKGKLKSTDRIVLNLGTKGIVGMSEFRKAVGDRAVVQETINGHGRITVSYKGENKVIDSSFAVRPGDEVILDASSSIALEVLPQTKSRYSLEKVTDAPWSNIGGLEKTIQLIKDEIELPFKEKETFAKYGRAPIKGMLLYGPAGCGKTSIARSMAYSLSQSTGKSSNFMYIKGPELLEKWVGNTEAAVRGIYATARACVEETGELVVIAIDEAESILKRRGSGISSDIHDTIVPQFNAEMDGLNGNSNIITVLLTNREDVIDPAILRDGRVDRRVRIGRPDQVGAEEILSIYLKGKPLENKFLGRSPDYRTLARDTAARIYSDKPFYIAQGPDGTTLGNFSARNVSSGAMLKGVVDRALGYAIKDEISRNSRGLRQVHLDNAVDAELSELANHGTFSAMLTRDDWQDVFGDKGRQFYSIWQQGGINLLSAYSQSYKEVTKK